MILSASPPSRLLIAALVVGVAAVALPPGASAQRGDLASALLRLDDLPAGWSRFDDGGAAANAALARETCGSAEAGFRPVDAAVVRFVQNWVVDEGGVLLTDLERGGRQLIHAIFAFAPGDGARALVCLQAAIEEDLRGAAVIPIPVDDLGEEAFGFRQEDHIRGNFAILPFEGIVATDYILVRRGDTIAALYYVAIDVVAERPFTGDAEFTARLARAADERLAAYLAR